MTPLELVRNIRYKWTVEESEKILTQIIYGDEEYQDCQRKPTLSNVAEKV